MPDLKWVLVIFAICSVQLVSADDGDVLLKFRTSLSNDAVLSGWNTSRSPPCTGNRANWFGVMCDDSGAVAGLQLEDSSLRGLIDVDALLQLPKLRSISFANNSFDGPMPQVNRLTALKSLFLTDNRFSGEIPDGGFSGMKYLKKVYLGRNQFTGPLPDSLVKLPKLLEVSVAGNRFSGKIPNFKQRDLQVVDFSDNEFVGKIPKSLSKMGANSFAGNVGLCGKPLQPCKSTRNPLLIIAIVIAAVVLLAGVVAVFFILRARRGTKSLKPQRLPSQNNKRHASAPAAHRNNKVQSADHGADQAAHSYKKDDNGGSLVFVRDDRERFDLQDLLRASAEVLGSGSFGSSYKANIASGQAVVVKRFRQMSSVGREEFHEHMSKLGRLSHPNLLPLVAFYYRREEKLLISDFVENGSLASHLHSNHSPGKPGLDWPTRLKVIKGVARGLAYLYKELPNLTLPHGHLKSSNVILDRNFEAVLSDYALAPVMNKDHAHQFMVAYKSPEFSQWDNTSSRKTDVWSMGILILELLTGKFPANYLKQGKGANADLATWVNSVVREEWTGEVFDKDMKGTRNGEGEMLKLLKIGMECCEWNLEKRWGLKEAVEKIEELKVRDSNAEEDFSSYASEGDMYSSRGVSEDDFSFSVTH
uniref:non-specific serine/threonine protein kinase n=1 Tax=Kalanchoe fedtschenkoi TaxID=63787 RepID=A0A7N0U7A4_KALFE